ncbi:MAG TPA: dockerin type I repeat-containing protein [Acetivibrio sp.]|nr:dockerin type I repeat-containing protein [Acetivibrio sp.]
MTKPVLNIKHAYKLKLVTLITAFVLFILCFSVFVHASQFIYGDIDGSGSVDSTDLTLIKRYILRTITSFWYEKGAEAADVSGDGIIDSTDLTLIKRYLLRKIDKFPAQTNQPTPSPTKPEPTPTATAKKGNVTYTLVTVSNPTEDQKDAYQRIKNAMDKAVDYYNTYTTITKELRVYYEPSVSTADGNINGTIRFGSNRSYMNYITAMHEIAHTVGVGTSSKWRSLMVNGVYTGSNAASVLREVTGDLNAVLKGDGSHFWPYGLNYTSEVKSEADLINHCKIVDAMKKDGL